MNHGSLFSGIGGFDLAAEWMGWENLFHCEWNEFGRKVLNHYWPKATSYEDITKSDFTIHRGRIDILTGGFPCQPYSTAGKRLGKEDDRHLWPEMLRAIREIEPAWVVGENVRGLVNWNGGMVFDEVQTDLEALGYSVQPFLLPAVAVNAPHRRDRIWFVAYSQGNDNKKQKGENHKRGETVKGWENQIRSKSSRHGNDRNATNTDISRFEKLHVAKESKRHERRNNIDNSKFRDGYWEKFPTEPPLCSGNDGVSGRLDGITFPKWRNESIKAGGNAIVPQVAYQIFKAIKEYESQAEKMP